MSESTCPFCRSALSDSFRATPARQAPRKRLTRAALFALGTGVAVTPAACSSGSSSGSTVVMGEPSYGAPVVAAPVVGDGSSETGTTEDCATDPYSPQCPQPGYGGPCPGDPAACFPVTDADDESSEAGTDGGTPDAGDASDADAASDASTDADADLVDLMPDAAYGIPPDAF